MPPAKHSKAKKGKGSKKPKKRSSKTNVADWASLSCKRSMQAPATGQFNLNTMYNLLNTQLTDFPRAVQVAGAFQHYRIKNITLTFKPSYDTYQVLAAGTSSSKPRLYYMIDKSGAIPTNVSLEGLKAMGAKPKDFDENNRIISWSPSVLESVMYAVGVNNATPSKYRVSPWLATNAVPGSPGIFVASGIDHLGLYWYVDQLQNPQGAQYSIEVEVQFEFKKPLTNMLSATESVRAEVATINDSPDGVVGGGDGI